MPGRAHYIETMRTLKGLPMPRTMIVASLALAGMALSGCVVPPPAAFGSYDAAYGGGYAEPYYGEPVYSEPAYVDPYYSSYGYTPYPVVGSSIFVNYTDRDRHRHRGSGRNHRGNDGHRGGGRRAEGRRADRRERRAERRRNLTDEQIDARRTRREANRGLSRGERRALRQQRRENRPNAGRGGRNRGDGGRGGRNRGANRGAVEQAAPARARQVIEKGADYLQMEGDTPPAVRLDGE